MDIVEILKAISKYTGYVSVRGGHGLSVKGKILHPSVSLEDAVLLAAYMGIGIRYYSFYNRVATTHSIVISETVETWTETSIAEATIKAVLTTAYRVAISGRR